MLCQFPGAGDSFESRPKWSHEMKISYRWHHRAREFLSRRVICADTRENRIVNYQTALNQIPLYRFCRFSAYFITTLMNPALLHDNASRANQRNDIPCNIVRERMNHSGLSSWKFVYGLLSAEERVGNFTEIELALYLGTEIWAGAVWNKSRLDWKSASFDIFLYACRNPLANSSSRPAQWVTRVREREKERVLNASRMQFFARNFQISVKITMSAGCSSGFRRRPTRWRYFRVKVMSVNESCRAWSKVHCSAVVHLENSDR